MKLAIVIAYALVGAWWLGWLYGRGTSANKSWWARFGGLAISCAFWPLLIVLGLGWALRDLDSKEKAS